MGCRPEKRIAMIMNNDPFTHPLPRTVLTVSKRDFGLLRQSGLTRSEKYISCENAHNSAPYLERRSLMAFIPYGIPEVADAPKADVDTAPKK
jgi:hypothetical protein